MKKMTKKIVAIVTMMMFIVTMMPFAAFANTNDADASQSTISLDDAVDGVVETEVSDAVAATLEVKDVNGNGDVTNTMTLSDVQVWAVAEKDVDNVSTETSAKMHVAKVLSSVTGTNTNAGAGNTVNDVNDVFTLSGEWGDQSALKFTFDKVGTYYIFAAQNGEILTPNGVKVVVTDSTVSAVDTNAAHYTEGVHTDTVNATVGTPVVVKEDDAYPVLNNPKANGIAKTVVKVNFGEFDTATSGIGKVAAGHKIAITTSDANIVVSKDNATTNYNGQITFNVKLKDEVKNGYIYLTCEDDNFSTAIAVNGTDDATATGIVANNTGVVLADGTKTDDFSLDKQVTFTLTNKKGNVITGANPAGLTEVNAHNKDYITIEQPKTTTANKLVASDVDFVYETSAGVYTLTLDLNTKKLVAGDYAITIALDNGATATAEFTVAKFDQTTAEKVLVLADKSTTPETTVADAVYPDQKVDVNLVWVDANGLQKDVTTNVDYSFVGKEKAFASRNAKDFTISDDATLTDKELYGTKVTVYAYDNKSGKLFTKELTVTQKGVAEALTFEGDQGEVQKNQTVKVTVVDENGNLVKDFNSAVKKTYVKVVDQSNKDANVTASVTDVKNGKATVTVYSDKATTADIQVVAYEANTNKIIAGTHTYTFGAKDPDADKSVVMTIGDKNFVVNNKVVTGDAAPYVKSNRTYVPIRALAESFSANVDWDNDARTVTVTRGDVKVVMTVGETTYTVNGKEATMDVAPEITGDRTYVPVRFVAEALGFTVTPFYAADGTTGSVLFQI